jgi:glycosyltransferase involved in cell wall biosynthesis
MAGITFSKQFPNPAEPLRGTFVAEQVAATGNRIGWSIIAPAPWVPRWASKVLQRPVVPRSSEFDGIGVVHPAYPVLPRRLLYLTVAPVMAAVSRRAYRTALATTGARFVHAHTIYPSGSAARRLCAETGLPLVLSVHGSDLYTNLVRPTWAREVRRTISAASVIVCVSTTLARDVVSMAGADASRVVVVPNAYDAARFTCQERTRADVLRLVSVGRLAPEKGFDVLIEAVGVALTRGLECRLSVVGAGPEEDRLRGLIEHLGLEDRVRLAGALDGDHLLTELRDADVFVSSSHREGFGVAILEALATGLPVVATQSGGPMDFIGPEDGLFVPPGDADALARAIDSIAGDLDCFDGASIARRALERFSPEVVGAQLVEVYERVVGTADANRQVRS